MVGDHCQPDVALTQPSNASEVRTPRGSATPTLSVGPERPRPTPLVEQQTLKLTRILDAHSTMSPPHVAATIIETPWIGCNRLLQ